MSNAYKHDEEENNMVRFVTEGIFPVIMTCSNKVEEFEYFDD